mmetsp:Transcript_7402/g.17375  ORF Transcript_7402/g.17375 Transcript_7402/m.17375 type:complete len:224 (-) Transcript_7402:338-1009(-)
MQCRSADESSTTRKGSTRSIEDVLQLVAVAHRLVAAGRHPLPPPRLLLHMVARRLALLALARGALCVGRDVLAVGVERLAAKGAAEDADRHEGQPGADFHECLLLLLLILKRRDHLVVSDDDAPLDDGEAHHVIVEGLRLRVPLGDREDGGEQVPQQLQVRCSSKGSVKRKHRARAQKAVAGEPCVAHRLDLLHQELGRRAHVFAADVRSPEVQVCHLTRLQV